MQFRENLLPGELLAPHICIICQLTPDMELGVVDTFRDLEFQITTHVTGRVYVCKSCASDMGRLVGLVPREALVDALEEANDLAAKLVEQGQELELLKSAQIDKFMELVQSVPKQEKTVAAKKRPA